MHVSCNAINISLEIPSSIMQPKMHAQEVTQEEGCCGSSFLDIFIDGVDLDVCL